MRTFHVGGTASTSSENNKVKFKHPIYVTKISGNRVTRQEDGACLFTRKGYIFYRPVLNEFLLEKGVKVAEGIADGTRVAGNTVICTKGKEKLTCSVKGGHVCILKDRVAILGAEEKVDAKAGSILDVAENQYVATGDSVVTFDPFSEPIISEVNGMARFVDLTIGTTLIKEVNEETGTIGFRVTDHAFEELEPRIEILDADGNVTASYLLPGSSYLQIGDNEMVSEGQVIARLLMASVKTKDITGGLPRVGELFEARKPRNVAVLSRISGEVSYGKIEKGKRVIFVTDENGKQYKHSVLLGRHILVREGDHVEAAERLCDGNIDPHDILSISGENQLQQFLLEEVQSVYRLQGVDINDKHLGIVVRQMLRKVEVLKVGDTRFIIGQKVDKYRFHDENARVLAEGGQPAIARPCLLGITNASLSIDSFISAASFQETTKVLTNAAIAGSRDELRGLKENVIIGHLIPAGTGMKVYRDVKLKDEDLVAVSDKVESVMSERALEDIEDLADMTSADEGIADEEYGSDDYSGDDEE